MVIHQAMVNMAIPQAMVNTATRQPMVNTATHQAMVNTATRQPMVNTANMAIHQATDSAVSMAIQRAMVSAVNMVAILPAQEERQDNMAETHRATMLPVTTEMPLAATPGLQDIVDTAKKL
jgi:hypothetical protein